MTFPSTQCDCSFIPKGLNSSSCHFCNWRFNSHGRVWVPETQYVLHVVIATCGSLLCNRFLAAERLFALHVIIATDGLLRCNRFLAAERLFARSYNYRNWRFTAVQPLLGLWKAVCASCCYRNWRFDARPVILPQCGPYMTICEFGEFCCCCHTELL